MNFLIVLQILACWYNNVNRPLALVSLIRKHLHISSVNNVSLFNCRGWKKKYTFFIFFPHWKSYEVLFYPLSWLSCRETKLNVQEGKNILLVSTITECSTHLLPGWNYCLTGHIIFNAVVISFTTIPLTEKYTVLGVPTLMSKQKSAHF